MEQIFNSLKELITPELVSVASKKLEEPEANISATIPSIFAGLLATLLKKGDSPQLKNILDEAGNLNILSNINAICKEEPTRNQQRIGDDFLQHLLGDKAADFTNAIAADNEISKVATNRLTSIVSPLIAGFLGNKIKKEQWSMSTLFNHIDAEKEQFIKLIPSDLKKSFGISLPSLEQTTHHTEKKTKKSNSWITWLIVLLALLLIFFWWRSCKNKSVQIFEEDIITKIAPIDEETIELPIINTETTSVITLPNGVALHNAYAGGIEDEIIKFLESDKYKNATENDLKNIWFDLDKIDFEYGSTTQLKEGYQDQLKNIIAILSYYKDTKIDVGGFADKKGAENVNQKISEERAKTFGNLLKNAGLESQIAKTEGFGEKYAKHLENEPENARAEDRHIALRFVK